METSQELEPVELIDRVAGAYVQGHPAQRRSRLTNSQVSNTRFRAGTPSEIKACRWLSADNADCRDEDGTGEMIEQKIKKEQAIRLMRAAQMLLDEAREAHAGLHLQHALDIAERSAKSGPHGRLEILF